MKDTDYLKSLMQYYDSKNYLPVASMYNMKGTFNVVDIGPKDVDEQYEESLTKLEMFLDFFETCVYGRPTSQYAMNPSYPPRFSKPLPIGNFQNYIPCIAFHNEDINARTNTFTIKNYDITNIITRIRFHDGRFKDVIFIQSSQDKGMMLPFVHRDPQHDVSRNMFLHRFTNEFIDWTFNIELPAVISKFSSGSISTSSRSVPTPNGIVSQVVSTLPDDLLPMPNTKYGYMDINAINQIFDDIRKDSELGGYLTDATDSWF
jgi:hypothetical protein